MSYVLTIATWNILGRRVDRSHEPAEPGAIFSLLERHDIDVLCLQEVHFYAGSPEQQLVDELNAAGFDYFIGTPLSPSHLDDNAELGVGIASRRPITRAETVVLSNPGATAVVRGKNWTLHDKGMIGCTFLAPTGRAISIYSLHLFPFHEFGVGETDRRVDDMWNEFWRHADSVSSTDRVAVLAGDFNHETRVHAADEWSMKNWHFCLPYTGTTLRGLALDDIALSVPPEETTIDLVPNFSDHMLAVVKIRLPTQPDPAAGSARPPRGTSQARPSRLV